MKFKKVEIQGFRAYGDKEDATFDFTIKKEVADLISIYAPNGFGKTSFYDAVEWTITNKIKRFEDALRNYDLIKEEKRGNREEGKYPEAINIISKKGYTNESKFVNIETTTGNFNKPIESAERRGAVDYDNSVELANPGFRDVILSQEGINSFLSVDKPEERYRNFIKNFDNEDLDRLHGNILALRKENEKRLKSLEEKLQNITRQLKKKIDLEVINKINQEAEKLQSFGIKLERVTSEFDLSNVPIYKSEITGITNKIILGESSLLERLKRQRTLLGRVESELIKYKDSLKQEKEIKGLIKSISVTIERFIELEKKNNTLKNLKENQKAEEKRIKNFSYLNSNLEDFLKKTNFLNEIMIKNQELNDYLKRLNNLEKLVELNITFFEDKRESLRNRMDTDELNLNDLKTTNKQYQISLKKVLETTAKLKNRKETLQKESESFENLKKELENLKLIEKNLKSGIFEFSSPIKTYKSDITKLKKKESSISKIEKDIEQREKNLKDSQSFQENLDYLLELGSKIVSNTKQSSCPLCKNEYADFEELMEKINSKNPVENSLSENFTIINQLEQELHDLKVDLQITADKLLSSLKSRIEKVLQNNNEKSLIIENIKKEIDSLDKENTAHQSLINKHSKSHGDVNVEEEMIRIRERIKEREHKTTVYETILEKYRLWLSKIKEQRSKYEVRIHNENKNEESIVSDIVYRKFMEFLDFHDLKEPEKKDFETLIKDSEDNRKKLENEISVIESEINNLKDSLKEFELNALRKRQDANMQELSKLNSFISEFNKTIESLDIDVNNKEQDIKIKLAHNNKEIEKNEEILRVLAKIEKMIEPLGDFLSYRELKVQENDLIREKKRHEKLDKDLKNEIKKIADRIEAMIESFFYDSLINKIYSKIDPHPQYKEIKFNVDFSDSGSPKLNIFTEDRENNGKRVPNLYFSTAQMNVLSLSIFLAKALHAVDSEGHPINTIFIDDPVQSMDSINVLSVIDLLRNIIMNHDKQIVISTHDENFFQLLKKKIPQEYFKSKFLELETFGRLKPQHA